MAASSLVRPASSPRQRWDSAVPLMLRPMVRAYALGYLSAVGPRLVTLLIQHVVRRRLNNNKKKQATTARDTQNGDGESFQAALRRILRGGLDWRRFPTFCAVLVGVTTLLEGPLTAIFDQYGKNISDIARRRLSRWLASFVAAWLSLRLLQSKQTPGFTDVVPGTESESASGSRSGSGPGSVGHGPPAQTIRYAGRTLDLTLFAVTRALDVIVGELWHRRKLRRQAAKQWTRLESSIGALADPAVFAMSSGLVMWTWFYRPERLPRAYNKWIGTAAAVDARLISALQRCHDGTLIYGQDTGQADLLGGMCDDYRWPRVWGDPARSIPFPCEMVHMGSGPSCERHAASRFLRSFRWALATHLPLALAMAARKGKLPTLPSLLRTAVSAARSSAFLASFIALFYYGVCLARTRLGPRLLGTHPAARQRIDGGVCVGAGCALCGWSLLLEAPHRRGDVALFVGPRALATLLPRRYPWECQWRETLAFAASTAVVLTCLRENRGRVRGVMGGVLEKVFAK